jgi:hypothetical protein
VPSNKRNAAEGAPHVGRPSNEAAMELSPEPRTGNPYFYFAMSKAGRDR